MNWRKVIRRFFLPSALVSLIYWLKYRCRISPRAEVDLSPHLKVGKGTQIGSFSKVKATDGALIIGKNVSIGSGSFLSPGEGGIQIGDNCLIAPNVVIIANNHGYARVDIPICQQEVTSKGIKIAANVWIGAGAAVLDGAHIEEGAIVTPNSVVSGRVAQNSIVQGNPATVVFVRR